jgi:hypothetical protein
MADIFISYSQEDRDSVRLLASLLEASRYTVWWDETLESGDDFSEVILTELEAALAVIVLWTGTSVRSTFVYAEAQAANHAGKLVPVRAGNVAYEQIRPPFNALHTVSLNDHEAILDAIERQIAKPRAVGKWLYQMRYQLLAWFGVVGTALTMLHALDELVVLSSWAHRLVKNWADLNVAFWNFLPKYFLNFTIPHPVAGYLSTFVFIASLSASSVFADYFGQQRSSSIRRRQRGELSKFTSFAICLLFCVSIISVIINSSEPGAFDLFGYAILLFVASLITLFMIKVIDGGWIWLRYVQTFPPYKPRHERPFILRRPLVFSFLFGGFIVNGMMVIAACAAFFIPILIVQHLSYEELVRRRIVKSIVLVAIVLSLSFSHNFVFQLRTLLLQ